MKTRCSITGMVKSLLLPLASLNCVNTAQAQLYVENQNDGTINEYDVNTGALIKDSLITGLHRPMGMALDGGYLYVAEYGDDAIVDGYVGKYDAQTGAAVNEKFIPNVVSPQAVAVSGNDLYVTNLGGWGYGQGLVSKYNAATGAEVKIPFITRLRTPVGIAVSGDRLFICYDNSPGAFGIFDAKTGETVSEPLARSRPHPDVLVVADKSVWVSATVQAPYGAVTKYNADTGVSDLGTDWGNLPRALVSGLDRPGAIAISGDSLFVHCSRDQRIAKYNANTGALINPSFISQDSIGFMIAVPVPGSGAANVVDDLVLMDNFAQAFTFQNIVVAGAVMLMLVSLAGLGLMRVGRPQVVAVPDVPQDAEPTGRPVPILKYALFGCLMLGLFVVGAVWLYRTATGLYLANLQQTRNQVVRQMEAQAPPPPEVTPMLFTPPSAPAILVDPQNFQTENNWLASQITERIASMAHLVQHPEETSAPDIQVHAAVDAEAHHVHLDITGFSGDPVAIDLQPDFAWDPHAYADLATKLLGKLTPDSTVASETLPDELTTLLQLTEPHLATEDVLLSGLLQKHPAWAAAHEQAALLLVALALRDSAGTNTDYRPMLSRATAHLALANALRGSTPPTWAGEITDAALRALSGREVDAIGKLDALSTRPDLPENARPWITALRLRARDDWRVATPDATSPLLLKIVWFQILNDDLRSLAAIRRLEKLGEPEGVPDWGHAALGNPWASVETWNRYCEDTTKQDLDELSDALRLENAAPDPSQALGTVLSEPLREKLYVGDPPVLKIIGPDMFKAFARQHLLTEFASTYRWLGYGLGENDEAEKFRASTWETFGGMRRFEILGFFAEHGDRTDIILKEIDKEHKTWEPWEIPDGYLTDDQVNNGVQPDADTLKAFYQDGLPFGTTYDIRHREATLFFGGRFHKKRPVSRDNYLRPLYPYPKDLLALAPSSYAIFKLDKNEEDLLRISQPWWDYDLRSVLDVEENAPTLDDDDYTNLLQKHASLDPGAWFKLGEHLRHEGKDDDAAVADRKGFDLDDDQVAMSNLVGPLVDYYFDHDRKDDAEIVAKSAADVYSDVGLGIYARLLEKMGKLQEAEEQAKAMADRYGDRSALDRLYTAHKDFFPDQSKIITDQTFPHGLVKVTINSFADAPMFGSQFTLDSTLLEEASLQVGDVVVALDGYQVENMAQYMYIRELSKDPQMDIIIWRSDKYLEVHASAPNRSFQSSMQDYHPAATK